MLTKQQSLELLEARSKCQNPVDKMLFSGEKLAVVGVGCFIKEAAQPIYRASRKQLLNHLATPRKGVNNHSVEDSQVIAGGAANVDFNAALPAGEFKGVIIHGSKSDNVSWNVITVSYVYTDRFGTTYNGSFKIVPKKDFIVGMLCLSNQQNLMEVEPGIRHLTSADGAPTVTVTESVSFVFSGPNGIDLNVQTLGSDHEFVQESLSKGSHRLLTELEKISL